MVNRSVQGKPRLEAGYLQPACDDFSLHDKDNDGGLTLWACSDFTRGEPVGLTVSELADDLAALLWRRCNFCAV